MTLAGSGSAATAPPVPTLINAVNLVGTPTPSVGAVGPAPIYGVAVDPNTGNIYAVDFF